MSETVSGSYTACALKPEASCHHFIVSFCVPFEIPSAICEPRQPCCRQGAMATSGTDLSWLVWYIISTSNRLKFPCGVFSSRHRGICRWADGALISPSPDCSTPREKFRRASLTASRHVLVLRAQQTVRVTGESWLLYTVDSPTNDIAQCLVATRGHRLLIAALTSPSSAFYLCCSYGFLTASWSPMPCFTGSIWQGPGRLLEESFFSSPQQS